MNEAQKTPWQYQVQIINEILDIFVARDTSSLILYGFDEAAVDAEHSVLDSLVVWMLKTVNSREQVIKDINQGLIVLEENSCATCLLYHNLKEYLQTDPMA
jgi:hypothetical protein